MKERKKVLLWLLIVAVLLAASILTGNHAGQSETIQQTMRDAVLHNENRINLLGWKAVNPGLISGFVVTAILLIAAAVLAACTGLRRFLNREGRKDRTFWGGRIRLTALWNDGAAFSLPLKRTLVSALSILILPLVWVFRRRSPIGAGLALGGGLSNLWERLKNRRVYDYVQFPKLPKLGRYVWNLADFVILLGGLLLALLDRKR